MPRIRVHVLHCGRIGVAPNLPASGQWRWPAKADARRTKADARIWLPVSAYLVEHPKGLFLVLRWLLSQKEFLTKKVK